MTARRLLCLVSLLTVGLTSLPAWACPIGNPKDLDYIRRDNNRCEGIQPRSVVSGGSIELISLTTSSSGPLGSTLNIRVPKRLWGRPTVIVRAVEDRYQLDDITFSSGTQFYSFSLPTTVLNRANIALDRLRATATSGDWVVYLPVILQRPASKYQFVFYSSSLASFKRAEIRRNGQRLTAWGAQNPKKGEKSFEWTPGAAAGRYEFYYEAEVESIDGRTETTRHNIYFEHNPDWLR